MCSVLKCVIVVVAAVSHLAYLTAIATAVQFQFVLLDEHNNRLEEGDALIWVHPNNKPSQYAGFYSQHRYYEAQFPDVDNVEIDIYTDFGNRRVRLSGYWGRRNHTLYLRVDRLESSYRRAYASESPSPIPRKYFDLLDLLDGRYPNGVPRNLTNIRKFLSQKVLPEVQNASSNINATASERNEANEIRTRTLNRIRRHLR